MNRKILLCILIILGAGFFLFYKSKTSQKPSEESLASTAAPSTKEENKTQRQTIVEQKPVIRTVNQVELPKSGKYALRISKPAHSIEEESAKRDQYLNQNKTGVSFFSADQKFVLMKLRASKEKGTADRALGHEIFPVDAQVAQKAIVDSESYPVVANESNGRLGLLTGVILVQLKNSSENEASRLPLRYPIDLQIYDSSISLASYKVRDGEDLYEVYKNIEQNEPIKSITVEVLDSYKGF